MNQLNESKTVFDREGGRGIAATIFCIIWGWIIGAFAAVMM